MNGQNTSIGRYLLTQGATGTSPLARQRPMNLLRQIVKVKMPNGESVNMPLVFLKSYPDGETFSSTDGELNLKYRGSLSSSMANFDDQPPNISQIPYESPVKAGDKLVLDLENIENGLETLREFGFTEANMSKQLEVVEPASLTLIRPHTYKKVEEDF